MNAINALLGKKIRSDDKMIGIIRKSTGMVCQSANDTFFVKF
jgi:hypothetical protein